MNLEQSAQCEKIAFEKSPYQSDNGALIGRYPDELTEAELETLGFSRQSVYKTIRAKCLDCCGGQQDEVRKCVSITCPLWIFRMGKKPKAYRAEVSDEQREAAAERFRRHREEAA